MDLKLAQRFLPYAAIAIITILFSLWYRRSRRCRAKSERSNGLEDDETEVSSPPVREDGFQYDVFLSFRGPDTRKTFADLLYEQLKDKGIITFVDSEKLEKGQKLEGLLGRVQRSKIFVPIFSPGYADSVWCLKEIAKMVECKRLILPVFVDVEPRAVRNLTGPFGSAFSKHRKNKEIDEVEVSEWSNALKEAGGVSGYTLATTDGHLGKLIQQIVKRILNEVHKTSKLDAAEHPVGLDSRIQDVIKVIETEAQDDVRMVGIWGMGGIGKTTLSTAVYNEISSLFDACSFISDVREAAERPSGLVSLQKQLLGDVFNEKDVTINNTRDGLRQIKERIGAKKVLLVLDDVNDVEQIEKLVGNLKGFRSGSRIIITTRDKRVLTKARVNENHMYELKGLDDIQSLELFSWHAFGKKEPDAKFADLSNEVASTTAGLPLALTIFGSHFFDLKTVELWRDTLEKLKEYPDTKIHERLKISYDVLDDNEKKVFLDIACFFVGKETKRATLMWKACEFFPASAINQLIHKSLVSINNKGKFEMHDHIRDMGRKIVQVKAEEAGKRSRLWKNDETVRVLENKSGTEDVEAIQLFCEEEDSVYVDVEYLAAMSQLRMLLLQGVTLKGGYEHFPRKLKWLKWRSQALEKFSIPLHLEMLVVLDLSYSSITQVCDPHKVRAKEANFQQLKLFFIPGRLINDGSSDPQSMAFILPKQFYFGVLYLYVDQSSLDNIRSELEKSSAASTLPDKSVASANEVMQPADCQLGGSVVHVDITTDDAQFSFPTCINGWDKNRRLAMATFARDSELMMMATQGRFKGNDVHDAQGRGMMEMCVSIDGCILLHGDLLTTEYFDEDPDDVLDEFHDIVVVKFG